MATHQIRLGQEIAFESHRLASLCNQVWLEFFARLEEEWDVEFNIALWVLGFDSATISLRPAASTQDESDPAWQLPFRISFLVDNLVEQINEIEERAGSPHKREDQYKSLEQQFTTWVSDSVVRSFQSAQVRRIYRKFSPSEECFSIFATLHDEGLYSSELTLLWKNDKGPTAAEVSAAANALKRKRPRKKVRKLAKKERETLQRKKKKSTKRKGK